MDGFRPSEAGFGVGSGIAGSQPVFVSSMNDENAAGEPSGGPRGANDDAGRRRPVAGLLRLFLAFFHRPTS